MIHKIVIENFFSIADQQEISLEIPRNAPDLPCFQASRTDPLERLPTVIGFFGPNASGKTTVLRALAAVVNFIRSSIDWSFDAPLPSFQPYMRKDWWEKPSKITIDFSTRLEESGSPFLFRYELHITHPYTQNHPTGKNEVGYESLSYAPKGKFRRLFERKGQDFKFGQEFGIKDNDPRVQAIRSNASTLSALAKLNHERSMKMLSVLNTVQTNIVGLDKGQTNIKGLLGYYAQTPDCLKYLNQELKRLDIGLEEMVIKQGSDGLPYAEFMHTGLDQFILMEEESRGTRNFIEVFPRLYYALATGGIAIIDEICSDFHPLLLPELLRWFYDPLRNPYKAQLFFTAHSPSLLDELEKEQIFFTQKLYGKPTEVYRASDIKGLRREPSLMNKYLGGVLGAIPYIG